MLLHCVAKVSPVFGMGGRFVRGGISSTVRNSQLECSKQFERQKLLSTHSVRDLPLTRAFMTRSHIISTALPKELMRLVKGLYTSKCLPDCFVVVAARTMHLWKRPNRYRASFHRNPSETVSGFSKYSLLLQLAGNADDERSFSLSCCTICSIPSTSTTSIQSSRKPGFVQDACVNARTASTGPLYLKCSNVWASRCFSTKRADSCAASSGDSRFPFSCCPTHSMYRKSGVYDKANACYKLGNPSVGTVSVVRVTAVKLVNKPKNEAHIHSCRLSDAFPASKILSASTLLFTIPPDRNSPAGHNQVFMRMRARHSSCCTSSITKPSYNFTQACHISSTTKPSSSSSVKKQEDPTAFSPSEIPENLSWNWWDMYIQGINPDYPPRQRMFAYLTSKGVCVKEMEIHEVEEFTKYLEMRRVYGDKFPALPYDMKFEDKLEDLRQKYPLAPVKTKKTKKMHE